MELMYSVPIIVLEYSVVSVNQAIVCQLAVRVAYIVQKLG